MRSAAAQVGQRQVEPLAAFVERAAARAFLFSIGELGLREAADKLQDDAEQSGLVARFGQDAIQSLLSQAFAPFRQDAP